MFDDDLELDTALFEVRRGGVAVALEPQAFDVLAYLVAHRDRVVPKEELMDAVWGGRFVSETAVTSRIKQARRAVGDDGQAQRLIRTLHGRGYRFVADVEVADDDAAAGAVPEARAEPSGSSAPVRYTVSDGLHIAYQVTGSGDRDIVLVSGFVSHLEQDWGDPRHAHYLERLGSWGRLIRFDKRGTGMSDRPKDVPDVETRMHDVLAVMDAVGAERAVLHGYSEGGAMVDHVRRTAPGTRRVARPLRLLRQADLEHGLPVGADRGAARRVHRPARRRVGLGGRLPDADALLGRGDAAVVGAADACVRDAVDDPRADGDELEGRRPDGAAVRTGAHPRPAPAVGPDVPRRRRRGTSPTTSRVRDSSCSTAPTTSCRATPISCSTRWNRSSDDRPRPLQP